MLLAGLWMALALEPRALAAGSDVLHASQPMRLATESSGVHGQLVVAPDLFTRDGDDEFIYSITREPSYGQVGLAGGRESDFFRNKTSRLGYFAYRPDEDFAGEDSFAYSVHNATTGVVYHNTVVITVSAPAPVLLESFEVTAGRERFLTIREVALTTRPNIPLTQRVPHHEDLLSPAERLDLPPPAIVFRLDSDHPPRHGTARLNPVTGELTYAPNPGFIGEDRFNYYTLDENNPHLGAENVVTVVVEPIRQARRITADRSRSREVDLVFVINNSPSMAAHQNRIAANLGRFRQLFHTRDLDYRIAVLTTDFVNTEPGRRPEDPPYKQVRSVQLDAAGEPVLDRRGRPQTVRKQVASNGHLVSLPVMEQPWVTPRTPDGLFAELVQVGTNGDSNRTAFTAVYNFVAHYYNRDHDFLRPEAPTFVVFFMDEEETRMATWRELRDGTRRADWIQRGTLPELIAQYNAREPGARQTLDGYINQWVVRPFVIAKGNRRGRVEMHAVVSPANRSHRRAAELTGGTVMNIESDFSAELAALGDRIADTVAVALEPVALGATLHEPSLRVRVDGEPIESDPDHGWIYDERSHSVRFQGESRQRAFTAQIEITYEEHR
jgi:hypothetical protein